jgi:hypothetical protein
MKLSKLPGNNININRLIIHLQLDSNYFKNNYTLKLRKYNPI